MKKGRNTNINDWFFLAKVDNGSLKTVGIVDNICLSEPGIEFGPHAGFIGVARSLIFALSVEWRWAFQSDDEGKASIAGFVDVGEVESLDFLQLVKWNPELEFVDTIIMTNRCRANVVGRAFASRVFESDVE